MKYTLHGFTLIEVVVAVFFFTTIAGYALVNLPNIFQKTALHMNYDTVVTDLRQQQSKAMTGDTQGRGTLDNYGIFFQTNAYVLFHGTVYNAADPTNTSISFENNNILSAISFPGSSVIFSKGSGEILGFTNGSNTLTLKNTVSGEIKTITINRYGVITQLN